MLEVNEPLELLIGFVLEFKRQPLTSCRNFIGKDPFGKKHLSHLQNIKKCHENFLKHKDEIKLMSSLIKKKLL